MRFFLGAHHANWLAETDVPLFVSRPAIAELRTLPRARGPWALDSGGFKQLEQHGRWTVTAMEYVALARRLRDEVGRLEWAAIQDWMCETHIIAKTGLSVEEHQRRTIDSYLELTALAPDINWVPVVQGWSIASYWRHVEEYARAGVDLATLSLVGIGSVCRRQATTSASAIVATLAASGLKLHAFGAKITGLRHYAQHLVSADSMAWSFNAFRNPNDAAAPECRKTHKTCANCLAYALMWRTDALRGEVS